MDDTVFNQKTPLRRKWKFSLVELLITIAIIAILAGALLPALNSARLKAVSITCTGNLKQLYTGISTYVSDSDGWLPFKPQQYNPEPQWAVLLTTYIMKDKHYIPSIGGAAELKGVFFCPARKLPTESPWWPAETEPASHSSSNYRETVRRVNTEMELRSRSGGWRNETSAIESGPGEKRLEKVLDGSAILTEKDYDSRNPYKNNASLPRNYDRLLLNKRAPAWHLHQGSCNFLMKAGNVRILNKYSRQHISTDWIIK